MTYDITFSEKFAEEREIDEESIKDLLWYRRVSLLFLELCRQVKDLVHDHKQVITAPLWVAADEFSHD